jgi:Leucine-rich repeat (LRR) protein
LRLRLFDVTRLLPAFQMDCIALASFVHTTAAAKTRTLICRGLTLSRSSIMRFPLLTGILLLASLPLAHAGEEDAAGKLKDIGARVTLDPATGKIIAVDLGRTTVVDADLTVVKELPALKSLDVDRSKITDAGLAHLEKLKDLEALDLEFTAVTDAGLAKLKGLTGLKSLDLESTTITDESLKHLAGLKGLLQLDVRGTKVTEAGAKKLQETLPKLVINLR